MPNLKAIKDRIKSVKSTEKITRAMKLVAASKVRKAQARVLSSRPYTEQIINFMAKAVAAIDDSEKTLIPLMQTRDVKSVGLVVISSDRGLCGSYNTNIIKSASKKIIELKKLNIQPKLILIGNKANNFFRRTKTEVLESFTQLPAAPTVELANLISTSAENAFINKDVDQVEIIGTNFISMLRNETYVKQFLPIVSTVETEAKNSNSSILFEPSLNTVLDNLLPLYLNNVIYHALLEASCSELASRMNAMSSATTNAKELIANLTIVYNKARQASITQELTEIVSGMEALK